MKLLQKDQIRDWDEFTIKSKGISSLDLMEQASGVFTNWFQTLYFDKTRKIVVLAGSGNNGGDGLCVSRMLANLGYSVETHLFLFSSSQSDDNKTNQGRLQQVICHKEMDNISLSSDDIVIDALLGSGISGPLKGKYLELVNWINAHRNLVISIDIPSGLDPDLATKGAFVHSDHVLSFERPKISFFFNEVRHKLKAWDYRSIGLDPGFLQNTSTHFHLIDYQLVKSLFEFRDETKSKADFGFGQLCGGSDSMFGSVILGASAAMRCGLGRLSVSLPRKYASSLISVVPEVMVYLNDQENKDYLQSFDFVNEDVSAVAVGPGLSTHSKAVNFVDEFLSKNDRPCILDADALNIIARNKWQERLSKHCIVTPHKLEFERLFGESENHFERVKLQIRKSKELGIYIVLKGSSTSICTPEGKCYFNQTGNVGMATAGSGDVLTGMILAFLAQGYSQLDATIMAVFAHGSAGDRAALKYGKISLIASDIIECIPEIIKNLYEE